MKTTIIAILALAALAACHEQRQDPPIDTAGIRAHAAQANDELSKQAPAQNPER